MVINRFNLVNRLNLRLDLIVDLQKMYSTASYILKSQVFKLKMMIRQIIKSIKKNKSNKPNKSQNKF